MNEAANIAKPNSPIPTAWVYLTCMAYLPAMTAVWLPAEKITIGNEHYSMAIWYQYSGQAVLAVLCVMLLLQLLVWQRKKHWMIWPGILAGLHAAVFAALRIFNLLNPKTPDGSLANTIHSNSTPMVGLYLLLIGGVVLLGVHGWVWRRREFSNRTYSNPKESFYSQSIKR